MNPPEAHSRAPWIILGTLLGVIFAAGAMLVVAGAAFLYVSYYGNPFAAKPAAVPHTAYSTRARLPDDMRDVAEEASDDFRSGKLDAAAAAYERILDKYPDCLYALSNLGVVRFTQKDYNDALNAFQRSVAMAPDDAFSLENLGITFYQLKRYDEAIDVLEKAAALAPNDAKAYNYLGCCYSEKGRQLDAKQAFKKAVELNNDFGDAYFNLALVYSALKPPDVAQAKENYQRALSLGIARDPRLEKKLADGPAGP